MYSVLPLEMKLAEFPPADIDRALLSRVDFAVDDIGQVLITVSLLSRMEAWDAARDLLQEHTRRNPWQPEIWLKAITIADRSRDADFILWARTGVLKYVWTNNAKTLHAEAVINLEDLIQA